MKIDELKDGIVLDHIQAGLGMEIYNVLNLSEFDGQVALIQNAKSKLMGKKDVLKIEGNSDDIDLNKIAYIDSNLTVNIIKNGELAEKKKISLPKTLKGVIHCKNPNCSTNHENVESTFVLTDESTGTYRCLYCETTA